MLFVFLILQNGHKHMQLRLKILCKYLYKSRTKFEKKASLFRYQFQNKSFFPYQRHYISYLNVKNAYQETSDQEIIANRILIL